MTEKMWSYYVMGPSVENGFCAITFTLVDKSF